MGGETFLVERDEAREVMGCQHRSRACPARAPGSWASRTFAGSSCR
jgi:hypothetical protein